MPSKPKKLKKPKQKCCISSSRCKRCPIRMLRDGTLPDGYTVKKRKLVQVGVSAMELRQASKKKGKKRGQDKRETDRPLAA